MRKIGLIIGLMLACTHSQADIAVANIWSAVPGNGNQLFMNGMEAKTIHEAMGASVSIAADQDGDMHYVLSFSDWAAWGRFQDAAASNEAWQSFWQRVNNVATAEISATYMLNMATQRNVAQEHALPCSLGAVVAKPLLHRCCSAYSMSNICDNGCAVSIARYSPFPSDLDIQ